MISSSKDKFYQLANFRLVILAIIAGYVCLSPSLKIVPSALIVTNFHDNQRLIELLILSLVLISKIFSNSRNSILEINNTLTYIISTLLLLVTISSFLAISPRHSFIEVSIYIGLCYLTFLIANSYIENPALLLKWLIYVFWTSILLMMLSFYTGYITATIFNTPVKWPNPLTGFSNIRAFNQYQLWTLGIITLPLLIFNFKKRFLPILINTGLVAWAVLLFFSASRGALLAWFFGIMITAIIYRKIAWSFIKLQVIHISLGFIGYKILFTLIPYLRQSAVVTGEVIRDTTYDRIELWLLALKLIKENPIFGVGPMHFAWYSPISAHPHNSVLQLMSEWGLSAALLIFLIAGYGIYCWLKRVNIKTLETRDKLQQNLAVALFFTLICSALYSLVDGVIVMPVSQVMMFTIVGLMIGFASREEPIETVIFVRKSLFAGVVLVVLIWSTLPEILQGVSGSEKHFSIGYPASGPRIWTEVKPE